MPPLNVVPAQFAQLTPYAVVGGIASPAAPPPMFTVVKCGLAPVIDTAIDVPFATPIAE